MINFISITLPVATMFVIGQWLTVASHSGSWWYQILACLPFWIAADYYAWMKNEK